MTSGENRGLFPAGSARPAGHDSQGRERFYHLDALRSILMILGVFLHTSYLYAGGKPWLVKDDHSSRLLLWVNESIHFFRIPCFFILSGFFAQMLLKKHGRLPFLKSRVRRLALPLASTAILLNSLQAYFIHSAQTHERGFKAFATSPDYAGFWKTGEWIGHLWFLVNVMVYSAAAVGLWAVCKRLKPRAARAWALMRAPISSFSRILILRGFFMLLLPLPQILLFAGAGVLPFLYWNWGGLSGFELLHFFPYFLFGLMIFLIPRLRDAFHRIRPWQILSIPAVLALEYYLGARPRSDWMRVMVRYLDSYLVWSSCAMMFVLFRFLLNRKHRMFAYLSEASYSIYLFHHVCVVGLGLSLADKDWNVLLKFWLIVGVSLCLSLAVHHFLVLRIRFLRYLFLGK